MTDTAHNTPAAAGTYTAANMRILRGLEAVRERPGMYIGDTEEKGYHHCAWEIIDNAADEANVGYGKKISVVIYEDGSLSVSDEGRGIPVDMHPEEGIPAATVALTMLHAGGKFDNDAYKTSGGLHGVGASVTNALSKRLVMRIQRDGYVWMQSFAKGIPTSELVRGGTSDQTGTSIRFWPDEAIFTSDGECPSFSLEIVSHYLRLRSRLSPGISYRLIDQRAGFDETWLSTGFVEILDDISPNKTAPIFGPVSTSATMETPNGNVAALIALRVHSDRGSIIASYANNIPTINGGTHDTGFRTALLRVLNDYGLKNSLIKERLIAEDVREGLVAAISVHVSKPKFSNQTKDKLSNSECNGAISTLTGQMLTTYLEEHPKEAKIMLARAELAAKARNAAARAWENVARKSPLLGSGLPGKLADCHQTDPSRCELFLVEGDSAGGSAKDGRDRDFQAILPLKGKILNVEKSTLEAVSKSKEIQNLMQAMGTGMRERCDVEKLRYHKIIIMTDADVDGAHIRTLLLTALHRLAPAVLAGGYVYIAQPPLYGAKKGKMQTRWLRDEEERAEFFKDKSEDGWLVQRFKGLGEMNPEQLSDTTMNPQKRRLLRVTYSENTDPSSDDPVFELLMGAKVEPRYEFVMDGKDSLREINAANSAQSDEDDRAEHAQTMAETPTETIESVEA